MTEDNEDKKESGPLKDYAVEITFSTFLLSLSSSALMNLGVIPNPISKETGKDLTSARQTIDLLKIFKEKTEGNLTEDEEKLMEAVLHELHTAYLNAAK